MRTRIDLFSHMNDLGLNGIGVEVGVMCGTFSLQILEAWHGKTLFLVDSWRRRKDYPEIANVPDSIHLEAMMETALNIQRFGDSVAILKMSSVEAAKRFKDGELDWVYIDANHGFKSVRDDLNAWYRKVRRGGIVSGHDYHNETREWGKCGVKRAVDRFFSKVNVIDEHDPSWWVVK